MLVPPVLSLSNDQVTDDGIYFLENGEDALVYVGNSVDTDVLQKIFGASSIDAIPTQVCTDFFGYLKIKIYQIH